MSPDEATKDSPEGVVYNTKESFNNYAEKCSLEFNNPVIDHFNKTEQL
jgi:hypothetical protein